MVLAGLTYFISHDTDREKLIIKENIQEPNRVIIPPRLEDSPFPVYEFENEAEIKKGKRRQFHRRTLSNV